MKRNRSYGFGAAITAALLCAVFSAQAAVPAVINYQSRLRTTAGAAITTATKVSFSLYSAATGGTALWTESYSQSSGACAKVTPDSNGYFSVQMGSCEAFPSTLTFTTPLYLGVTIENDAEASPRVAFAPAPYAMNAVRVGNFVSDTSAGTLTGEPLGTATAGTQGFHSAGLLLQGSGWNGSAAANKGFKVRTTATDASNYRLSILDSGDGSESVSILNNGRVGIGITNPQSELEVAGVIYANDFRTRGGSISTTGDGTNDLIRFTRPKLLVGFTSDLNNPTSNLKSLMSLTSSDVTFLENTSFDKLVSIPNRQIKFGANTFTFPVAAPAADGLVLTTDTDGTLSWTSKSSGGGGTVSSVGLSAPSAEFLVAGSPVTDTGTLSFAWKTQQPNDILAGPSSGTAAGAPTFRNLVAADIPNLDAGKITSGTINAARLPTLTAADIPNLDAGKITSGILDTPRGGTGIGTYAKGQIIYADAINSLATLGLGSNGTVLTANSVTGLPEWKAIPSSSGGTVTSVSATIPSSLLTLSGSPITDSGTLAFDLATQSANEVFVGPLSGPNAKPTFRALSAVDIPSLDAAKTTTGTFALGRIPNIPVTQGGTGITSNAKGDILYGDAINSLATLGIGSSGQFLGVDATGVPAWKPIPTDAGGTVKSVAFTAPSIFSVIGTPITDTGTIALSLVNQSAKEVLIGPSAGAAPGTPTFRVLEAGDIPSLDASKVPTGVFSMAQIPNLDTTKINFPTLAPGKAFIGPASGIDAKPDFRSLVASDIPDLDAAKIVSGEFNIARIPDIPSTKVTGTLGVANIPDLSADKITSGTLSADRVPVLDIATKTSGTLGVTRGGTGIAATAKGDILFSDAINSLAALGIGSTGQVLSVNSAGLPVWSAPATNGTVTSVGLTAPSILTVAGSPVTGSGNLALDLATQAKNEILAGPLSGVNAKPTFRSLASVDIPDLDAAKITTGIFGIGRIPDLDATKIVSGTFDSARIPALTAGQIPDLDAAKIVSGEFNIARIPDIPVAKVTGVVPVAQIPDLSADKITSGTLSADRVPVLDIATKTSGTLGVTRGGTGIAATAKGDILFSDAINSLAALGIGSTGQVLSVNSAGLPVWSAPATNGTVTSVGLTAPSSVFTVSGSPVTGSGDLAVDLATQSANEVFVGPLTGTGKPTFRSLASVDIPDLDAAKITTGIFGIGRIPDLDATKIVSGTFDSARIPALTAGQIPDLDAAKIVSGEFNIARIPDIPVAKVTGVVPVAQIPDLSADKITSGTLSADRVPVLDIATKTSGTLGVTRGGTGIAATAKGDILFSDAINSLAALGIGAEGKVLTANGTTGLPEWRTASGDISGSGTANSIAFFTAAKTIANSLISQTGGNIDITSGNLQLGGVTRIAANGNATFTTTTITEATIGGGAITKTTIDNSTIGGTTPAAGTFTNLAASNLTATNITGTNISATNVAATNLSASGAMTLGDSASDVLNIKASIGSDIIPSPTNLRNLGSSLFRFANLFADKINVAGITTFNGVGYSWPVAAPASNGRVLTGATDGTLSWGIPADGTVTSVGLSAPSIFTVAGSPVTATGTLALDLSTQAKNKVFAGPTADPDAKPTFRALVAGDIPSLPASQITSGVFASSTIPDLDAAKIVSGTFGLARIPTIPVTQGGTGLTGNAKGDLIYGDAINSLAKLGIGSTGQILAVNSAGLPVWQAAPATGVTSVGLSLPSLFTVNGSPVTASGTLSAALAVQGKNKFFGGPVSGADATPDFRALDAQDIPNLDAGKITSGVFAAARIPAIATSSVPDLDASKITSGVFNIARIPNIPAANITGTLATSSIPSLDASKIGSGILGTANGGTGLSTVGADGTVLTATGGVPAWRAIPAGLGGSGSFGQLAFWNASSTLAGNSKIIIDNTNSRVAIGTSAAPATTLVVAGDTTVGGHVIPSSASAFDFGSTTKPARSVYSDNLGSATQRIKAAYIDELYIYGGAGGSGTSTISATQTVFNGISYNWPSPPIPGNNFVLTTDTSGNLNWKDPTSLVPESGWRSLAGNIRLGVITDKVGIGTAAPAEKLDVVGNVQASGFLSSAAGQIKFGGATYNFPTSLPSSGQILSASSTAGSLVFRGLTPTDIPSLDASKITTGTFAASLIPAVSSSSIPNLDAFKITSGVFNIARIPNIPAANITGTLATSSIPSLDVSQISSGVLPVVRGGTGLSAVGANGQVLTTASGTIAWVTPASGIGGSGTVNKLALFSATGTIADSILSQAGGAVTSNGNFNIAAGNNINVLSGNVTVGTGATTTVVSSGAVVVGGNLTVNSLTTLNGTVAINAGLMGDLKPVSSGGSALGSATSRFNNLFTQGIDVNGGQVTVNGIKYNWPSTAPTAGQMLAVNSAGAINGLVWQAPGTNDIQRPGTANLSVAASMPSGVTGQFNVALGGATLGSLTSGSANTGLGSTALELNQTGNENTAVGTTALRSNVSGNRNTAIGRNAGFAVTGSGNTFIGAGADASGAINNSIAIGDSASATKSNQVVLGRTSITETLLRGNVITGGSIIPESDNSYDLGSLTNRWRDIYIGPATIKVVNNSGQIIESIGEGSGANSGKLVVKGSSGERLIGGSTFGSGTAGTLPVFNASGTLSNSLVSQVGGKIAFGVQAQMNGGMTVRNPSTGTDVVTLGYATSSFGNRIQAQDGIQISGNNLEADNIIPKSVAVMDGTNTYVASGGSNLGLSNRPFSSVWARDLDTSNMLTVRGTLNAPSILATPGFVTLSGITSFSGSSGRVDISMPLRIASTGSVPGVGKVLTSDNVGNATWQPAALGETPTFTGDKTITGSLAVQGGATGTGKTSGLTLGSTAGSKAYVYRDASRSVVIDTDGTGAAGNSGTITLSGDSVLIGRPSSSNMNFIQIGAKTTDVVEIAGALKVGAANTQYTFPYDNGGAAGKVLTTIDASGTLGWQTPAGALPASVTAGTVLAGPLDVDGAPDFRALTAADIPNIDAGKITTGTLALARIPTIPVAQGGTGLTTGGANGDVLTMVSGAPAWVAPAGGGVGNFSTLTVSGATTLNGSVSLGDASTDSIAVNGKLSTGLIPNSGNTIDLGTATASFRSGYLENLYTGSVLRVSATGAMTPTSLTASGNAIIQGSTTLNGSVSLGDASTDSIAVNGKLSTGLIPNSGNTIDLGTATASFRSGYLENLYTGSVLRVSSAGAATFSTLKVTTGAASGRVLTSDSSGNATWQTAGASDRRLKENITELSGVLEKLHAVHGVNFTWKESAGKDDKSKQLGVIAQDVEKVFPELVSYDEKGMRAVNYPSLAAVAVQGVKELDAKVESALPTAGIGVIAAGENAVLIKSAKASESAKIFVTAVGSMGGQSLYVGDIVDGKYFTVKTDKAVRAAVRFNWMIVE